MWLSNTKIVDSNFQILAKGIWEPWLGISCWSLLQESSENLRKSRENRELSSRTFKNNHQESSRIQGSSRILRNARESRERDLQESSENLKNPRENRELSSRTFKNLLASAGAEARRRELLGCNCTPAKPVLLNNCSHSPTSPQAEKPTSKPRVPELLAGSCLKYSGWQLLGCWLRLLLLWQLLLPPPPPLPLLLLFFFSAAAAAAAGWLHRNGRVNLN